MNLKNWVESALNDINRPLSWLAAEMDRTTEGLKLSIDKETMKFSDLKKMIAILHKPITVQLNGNTTIQSVKGNYNQQNIEGTINEPNAKYKYETQALRDKVAFLENIIKDKEYIIELLSKKE